MGCRVLKKNDKKITFVFKGASHKGIDLVGPGATLDYITAHSDGTVVGVVSNINYNTSKTGQRIYGNYVKIKHDNGMYTLYAHMQYGSIKVSNGQRVSKGQVIGYMGNTGYAFGAHLHFEVRNTEDKYIDPTPYIDADLPSKQTEQTVIKSNDEIANEVIAGKWGNGEERRTALTNAGYNYSEIQSIVNNKMKGTSVTNKKTNEEIANEVIKGLWGNGQERKDRLFKAGYNYNEVQAIVNQKLK